MTHILSKKWIWLSLLLCAVLVFSAVFAAGCEGEGAPPDEGNYQPGEQPPQGGDEEVQGLVIPLSDLTATPKFYGVTVEGTYLQVIAFNYNGSYRTAFNTCQVCYGSPKAYFKMKGKNLQCQNCGRTFTLSQVGMGAPAYDCIPYPIQKTDRVQTADSIVIPDEFLINSIKLFKNWGGAQV